VTLNQGATPAYPVLRQGLKNLSDTHGTLSHSHCQTLNRVLSMVVAPASELMVSSSECETLLRADRENMQENTRRRGRTRLSRAKKDARRRAPRTGWHVSTLRFRFPDGSMKSRRFKQSARLSVLQRGVNGGQCLASNSVAMRIEVVQRINRIFLNHFFFVFSFTHTHTLNFHKTKII